MARLDHDSAGTLGQQEWRGKRPRHEDVSEALARALLETVRQALDEGPDNGAGSGTRSETSGQRNAGPQQNADGGLGNGSGGGKLSDSPGPPLDTKSEHNVGWFMGHIGAASGMDGQAVEDMGAEVADDERGLGPVLDSRPSATDRQRPAGEWDPQAPQHARGTASFDSATTTLNTGEEPAEGRTDDAADPDVSTGDEGPGGGGGRCGHRKKSVAAKMVLPGGPCAHCGTTESPQWRRPLTRKVVLCNACGIYFSRHHSLPKRKKANHGSTGRFRQEVGRKDPAQSIICDEELELDDQGSQLPAGPGRGARKPSRATAGRQLNDLQRSGLHLLEGETELGQQPDLDHGPVELPRVALSLPLMMPVPLPVLGGINVIVQSFLKQTLANQ